MGFRSWVLERAATRLLKDALPCAAPAELPALLRQLERRLLLAYPRATPEAAAAAALRAWARDEARRSRCYVDLQASSPGLIYLVDEVTGRRRPIPVADLVRILGPRAAA